MRLLKSIVISLLFIFALIPLCHGDSLNLEWNPNGEGDLAGYYVYYGTSPGSYGDPIDVENVTEYELTGLDQGVRYYVAISAYDTSDNESEKSDEESGVPPDTQNPSVIITIPTASSNYSTSNSTITLGGTASDNVGVTVVSWVNNRGGNGTASGTTSWSISGITLQAGNNTITVTGRDAADNTGTDTIIINYTPLTTTTTSVLSTTTTSVASTTTTAPTTTTSVASTTTTVPTTTTSVVSTTTTAPVTTTTPTTIPAGTTTIPATTTVQPGENPISGKIIINNGEPVTDSPVVTLTLFATVDRPVPATSSPILAAEELGPDAVMSISNDGQQWSPIEPYRQTKQWTLVPGDGVKTVYAQFSEGDGKWMAESAQAQIILEGSQSTCADPQKIQPLSVTASSASPLYSADNLIDGDPSTAWSSVISFFKKDQYITLDFGTTKKISGLTMYASQLFGVDFFPTNFSIQVSQDNATWIDISREQGYVFGQSSSSGNWDTNGHECQFIRIHITRSKTLFLLFKLAQIAEIEVYGCETAGELPLLAGEKSPGEGSDQQQISTQHTADKKTENRNIDLSAPGRPAVTFLK